MVPVCSLPHSQAPATSPCSEPDQSSPCLPSHFLKAHFNIIVPPMPQASHIDAMCPVHLLLDLIIWLIFSEEYILLSSLLYSLLDDPVTLSFLGPNILLSTLFSNTLSLCTILIVSDQVSHPYKTTGKVYNSVYLRQANWTTKDFVPNDSSRSLTSICL